MKDLVSLLEDGDRCGYCQEFWQNCKCLENFGDDFFGDDYSASNYHNRQPASEWRLLTRWSY